MTSYAKCQDCDVDLADRAAINAHSSETMTPTGKPTGKPGVVSRGHHIRIVNPTEGERRASRARLAIADALSAAVDHLVEVVDRGDVTADEIGSQMWGFDLADEWDQYLKEDL